MKLALVVHHARSTGGQDRYALELARQLAARHEVHLVTVRAEGLGDAPVTVHRVGVADRPLLLLTPRFARAAAALLRRHRFDVVHAVGGCLPGASVVTTQYCHAAWGEAKRRYRVRERSLARELYQDLVNRQSIAFDRRAYADPGLRAVIAVSRGTQQDLARWHGVAAERVTMIPNGVDPDAFARARHPEARVALRRELGLRPETKLALLVGTYARKGLDTAIAAAARAAPDLHLAVAGAGDAAWAWRHADAAGFGARLHLLGPRRDVAALFAAADLFVLPTRYEPFGMVIVEAMASSLPVVVSAGAGAAELIRHGESGYAIAEPGDADGFGRAMREVLDDPARAAARGGAGREAALAAAWPRVAAATEAVYAGVAG